MQLEWLPPSNGKSITFFFYVAEKYSVLDIISMLKKSASSYDNWSYSANFENWHKLFDIDLQKATHVTPQKTKRNQAYHLGNYSLFQLQKVSKKSQLFSFLFFQKISNVLPDNQVKNSFKKLWMEILSK